MIDWEYAASILPRLLQGTMLTIELMAMAFVAGMSLAVAVALARVSANPVRRWPAWLYIQVIRGTPLLVQIYLFYYGLGSVFARTPAIRHSFMWPYLREGLWYAVIALGVSTGAYAGEILRGAIQAVPRGEAEAAASLGLRPWQVTRLIVLPRAIGNSLPALGGETILTLKATALASTITVMDLMGQARFAKAQSLRLYEPLLEAAVIYIVLTLLITRAFAYAEHRMGRFRRPVAP